MTTTSTQRKKLIEDLGRLRVEYSQIADHLGIENTVAQQRFNDVLTLWWEVVSDDLTFMETYVDPFLSDPNSVAKHDEVVHQLTLALRQRDAPNIETWTDHLLGILRTYVRKAEQGTIDRAGKLRTKEGDTSPNLAAVQVERRTIGGLVSRVEQIDLSHRLRAANREADKAVQLAQKAAEDARTAAGIASRSKLTTRFNALARRHFWAATTFRILTAVGVLAGLWGALNVPVGGLTSGTDTATAEAILRVSLLAGVLGLATYFGRQAAYHRDVSTWASTIKEQLLTFDGYIDPVDDANLRDQMRAAFAARVFGSSPESKEEPGVTLSSPVLSEVAAIFTKAGSPRP